MQINWYPGHMAKAKRLLQDQVAILDRDGVLSTGLSTDVLKEQNLSELYGTELKLFYEGRLGREVCAAPQFAI